MLKNSSPRLREVIGGTETNIYCQATTRRACVLAVTRTIKVGLTKFGNQAKPPKYSGGGDVISYQMRPDVQTTATDLNIQPTPTQKRLMCTLRNARLLPDGCCCHSDAGNKSLFRILNTCMVYAH